jgi:hypothetical protein
VGIVESICARFARKRSAEGEQEKREMKMRKTLMTTVAAAAVVGFAAMAAAQTPQAPAGGGAAKPEGGQVEQKGGAGAPGGAGGAMQHPQGGAPSTQKSMSPSAEKSANPSAGKAAQGAEPGAKTNEKMGQSQKNEATPQRGAQEERTTTQKGAQTEHATPQKGAEESGKAGIQQNAQAKPGARGTSVQLSQDQRSRITAVIGKTSSTRASTNVNFNVTVGANVPRDVHVEVLPADVVQIVPQYEGFDYIVVGDQILIVDPASMEIVAVIET